LIGEQQERPASIHTIAVAETAEVIGSDLGTLVAQPRGKGRFPDLCVPSDPEDALWTGGRSLLCIAPVPYEKCPPPKCPPGKCYRFTTVTGNML
jgi:hypothetical protein